MPDSWAPLRRLDAPPSVLTHLGRMKAHSYALPLLIGAALHLSACASQEVQAPSSWTDALESSKEGWLMNIHARAQDERYAVGGRLDQGTLSRFDGESWVEVDLGVEVPLLNWIHSDSSGDMVAVGRDGIALHREEGLWRVVSTPTSQTLWGVWGSDHDDLWAVGGDARISDTHRALVLRWDGVSWTEVTLPETSATSEVYAWFKVWGSAPNDVYLVGQQGALMHWDGAEWTHHELGIDTDLIAVWGLDGAHVALVGGRNNGVVARWDGVDWLVRDMAPMPGLNGVWMRDPGVIHVAGNYGTLARLDFATLETLDESVVDTMDDFHALHGAPEGVLTAVGGNLLSQGAGGFRGVAYHRALQEGE